MVKMSPNKQNLYYDLDNGGQVVQQLPCRNDSQLGELQSSPEPSLFSETFSSNASDLETGSEAETKFHDFKSIGLTTWELGDMHQRGNYNRQYHSHSPLAVGMNNEEMINISMYNREAHLVLKTPPEHRFRYRYDTEMSGTHGSLQGIRSGSEKSVPEVELVNYPHEALIRVSLVTCNEAGERYPHPHNLFIKEKMYQKRIYENLHNKSLTKTGHYSDPHYIRVGMNGLDYVARFEGMCIISSKKENFSSSIKEKLHLRDVEQGVSLIEKEDFSKKVDEAVKLVDLDFVSLCFEAFREEGARLVPICAPLYSEPIGNAKSANTGKLKISRINKCSGSCKGGDEIWLLVEKINKKGLVIRFFEECDGKILWDLCIGGDDITLHHQYAIIFKTPAYRDTNISSEVKVLMRLERSSQLSQSCNYSEPITFVYEPQKNKNHRSENLYKKESILSTTKQSHVKRPRIDSSIVPNINFQYKRKKDEQDCSNDAFDSSDFDHIISDIDFNASSNQFWSGFNVNQDPNGKYFSTPDFFQLLLEDMPFEKDGVSSTIKNRKDRMQVLQMIYSKFDENEIKKLTDRMNNIRFSKGKSKFEGGGGGGGGGGGEGDGAGDEKREVEDAVTTLLSLRERAVETNNLKKETEKDECSTLYQAVLKNKPDVAKKLLKVADFSHQDNDLNTPLHLSLLLGHDACTDYLLEFRRELRESVNLKNKEGKTPLHLAAANGSLRHIKLLLECGANVNETETKTKRNALHIAGNERNREVAEYLIENTDICLDALDAEGQSALGIADLLIPSDKVSKSKEVKTEKCKESKPIEKRNGSEINLDKLYETLNETGSWRILAEMMNCSYLIPSAEEAQNPAKCVLSCSEQINGEIEPEALRDLLDAINEKKGLLVLDEILARRFV